MNCSTPGLPVHHQLPEFTSIESVMSSSHLILYRPLLLLPPIPPSIRVFSNESTLRMRWPKYWSFSLSIIPSKEIPGLISFRMDWLDLLAVQRTLKSLLQHHSSKASILWSSAFFTVQLSHLYMTTGKTIALTRWTFVGKVMSLLLNMLSSLVITFLPRNKHLNFMAAVTICSESFIIQTKCLHPAFSPIEDIIEAHMLRICSHRGNCLISLWNLLRSGIKPVSCVGKQILYHWDTREAL